MMTVADFAVTVVVPFMVIAITVASCGFGKSKTIRISTKEKKQ